MLAHLKVIEAIGPFTTPFDNIQWIERAADLLETRVSDHANVLLIVVSFQCKYGCIFLLSNNTPLFQRENKMDKQSRNLSPKSNVISKDGAKVSQPLTSTFVITQPLQTANHIQCHTKTKCGSSAVVRDDIRRKNTIRDGGSTAP